MKTCKCGATVGDSQLRCPECRAFFDDAAVSDKPVRSYNDRWTLLLTLGIGLFCFGYWFFDATVDGVYNIGLLHDRDVIIYSGLGISLVSIFKMVR